MKKFIISIGLACATAPAAAQAPAPAAQEQLDPERLALATTVAGKLLPEGSYARMMSGSVDQMMDGVVTAMLDLEIGTIAEMFTEEERKEVDPELLQMSMREVMEEADPHFTERMTITNRTIWAEMIPLMSHMEPQIREALAVALARRFDAAALADIDRFFATTTGSAFAAESLTMWMDPEMTQAAMSFMPEMMKQMPSIMAKVEAATAHLPPEPDPDAMKSALLEMARK